MAAPGAQPAEAVVRTPVPLGSDVLDRVREHLETALGRPVLLSEHVDERAHSASVCIDGYRNVSWGFDQPLGELKQALEHAMSVAGPLESAQTAAEAIADFEPHARLEVRESNLRRLLVEADGHRVVLRSRSPVEADLVEALKTKLTRAAGREIDVETSVEPRLEYNVALQIGNDRRIVLDQRHTWVEDLERSVRQGAEEGLDAPGTTGEFLRGIIGETEPGLRVEAAVQTGAVLEVGDGVALVSGLRDVGSQELVEFEGGIYGLAFSLLGDKVGCILLGPEEGIREGSGVKCTGHLLRVPVGDTLMGRIVNALGQPIDGKGAVIPTTNLPVERKAPGVVQRSPVDTPLHTGWKVVDALVPLGRGQRELIIGDRKIGKTTIAIDTILSQRGTGVTCIYAAIGQKASSVARVVRILEENGAMEYTIVVVALPNEPPAFRYIAPYAACAMGEYFMDQGKDALVVYDDLTKHAVTYREMSALLKRPVGREAYPGDIFYVHSRLLERAARMSDQRGGGSLTALPIIETLAGDISAFIPTNVISICDGQIYLDTAQFNEGKRPAMDSGLSVSRVGGSAQTKVMKQVAGRLRIDLAQYEEMAQFVKFGAEVDSATLQQLERGERCRELLKQGQHEPLSLAHEVLVLYAVINGMFRGIPVEDLGALEKGLIRYADVQHPAVLESLRTAEELTGALEADLNALVESYLEQWARAEADRPHTPQVEKDGLTGDLAPGAPVVEDAGEPLAAGAPASASEGR
jgi:F-type H+-transporting ATPase subunit alpha